MDHLWIALTVFAALMQAVRTAAQRDLNRQLSTLATTYVRSLFGLPVMIVYLVALLAATGGGAPALSWVYLGYTLVGALAQVLATMLLIRMFRLKSFGVGTMLTKTDVVITAVLGALVFGEAVSAWGAVALLVVLAGVVAISVPRTPLPPSTEGGSTWSDVLRDPAAPVALACAFSFTVSYLTFREATQIMPDGGFLWRGAWTVTIATAMQTLIVGAWLVWSEPSALAKLWPNRRMCGFIGLTSSLGSIGWFTAFALQNAAYVRAVGQIEVVFTLLIAALYFRERLRPQEWVGIALTMAGVLMFRLLA